MDIQSYQAKLPEKITVTVSQSDDGFFAEIQELHNCFTQADTQSELIEMVNDAIFTYLEIPAEAADRIGVVYLPEALKEELLRRHIQAACANLTADLQPTNISYQKVTLAN